MNRTFMDLCLSGAESPSNIDTYIDQWHLSPASTPDLHEYLGMTWEEYQLWVTTPSVIDLLLTIRFDALNARDEEQFIQAFGNHQTNPITGLKISSTLLKGTWIVTDLLCDPCVNNVLFRGPFVNAIQFYKNQKFPNQEKLS